MKKHWKLLDYWFLVLFFLVKKKNTINLSFAKFHIYRVLLFFTGLKKGNDFDRIC